MLAPAHALVEENLRTALQFFGHASGTGAIEERDGMKLIDSGVNYPVFNIAMMTGPVAGPQEFEQRIAAAGRWFAARNTGWSLWLCEDHLPRAVRSRLSSILYAHRLRALTEAPGMIAASLAPPQRALPEIEWRPVGDVQSRLEFAHITTVCFDIPFATSRAIYGPESAWQGDYQGYLAYANGVAVSTTAVVVAAGSTGFYSVSTLPDHRRRGYAEALMRQVYATVRLKNGPEQTVLQATRSGQRMYERMGYRQATNFLVFISS